MKNDQKEYCANNLVARVIEILTEEQPGKSKTEVIASFMESKTYALLMDFSTRLWAEGPDYIIALYEKEK